MDEDYEEEESCQQTQEGELTAVQEKFITEMYEKFDLDGNGILSFKELRKGLQFLGLNPTVHDVKEIMKKYKLEKRKIGYEEFKEIMQEMVLSKTDTKVELTLAFSLFDKNNDGCIDKQELKVCLRTLGEKMTDSEIDKLFSYCDADHNGKLSIVEMTQILAG